jgi:hypothetical protein
MICGDFMRVIEALRDIDGSLVEWLMKEGLTPEQRDALVEARSDLIRVEARMLVARVLDPEEDNEFSRSRFEVLGRLAKG